MISARENPIIMTEITDPATIADMNTQFERMRKNTDWLQALGPTLGRAAFDTPTSHQSP